MQHRQLPALQKMKIRSNYPFELFLFTAFTAKLGPAFFLLCADIFLRTLFTATDTTGTEVTLFRAFSGVLSLSSEALDLLGVVCQFLLPEILGWGDSGLACIVLFCIGSLTEQTGF